MQILLNRLALIITVASLVFLEFGCQLKQSKGKSYRTWRVYKGDAASTSYSELKQISKDNVHKLKVIWTFHTNDAPNGARYSRNESSPIVVDSMMYVTSPWLKVFALNAYSGNEIWSFDPFKNKRGRGILRSVVYWQQGSDRRILFTAGDHLFALNAKTGTPVTDFGQNGKVSLNKGLGVNPQKISVGATSPGIVYKNLLILGSSVGEGYDAPPGYVRAYDIKTGNLEWIFHTIPRPGELGYKTWPKDAWKYIGGVNVWAGMSLDKKRGMVFLPVGSPVYDFYGGNRKGENLYGDCVVALDAETGKHIWHYQTVHHDLWDYDPPAPPNLVTVERDGKKVDAVAQVTKTGFIFLLNRETGKPLFRVKERKVPSSDIPGEESWPTQPFPVAPKPFSRQSFTKTDVTNISRKAHDSVLKKFKQLRNEGLFTPPSTMGTISIPAKKGGAEWGGAAFDPATHVLYVNGNNLPAISKLTKRTQNHNSSNSTLYSRGKTFYMNNCAACHGTNRRGKGNDIPSLTGIGKRMTKKEVLHRIKNGGGRMPAFTDISESHARNIIAYLFNIRKEKGVPNQKDTIKNKANNSTNPPKYIDLTVNDNFNGPGGFPAIKPPWGTLNAINLNTGKYEWKIPLGMHSELKRKGSNPTGTQNMGGPIVTAGGLVFIGATSDNVFRAFDKKTGKLLWKKQLSGQGRATPVTYMSKGKQFVVISLSGSSAGKPQDSIVAFALPDNLK